MATQGGSAGVDQRMAHQAGPAAPGGGRGARPRAPASARGVSGRGCGRASQERRGGVPAAVGWPGRAVRCGPGAEGRAAVSGYQVPRAPGGHVWRGGAADGGGREERVHPAGLVRALPELDRQVAAAVLRGVTGHAAAQPVGHCGRPADQDRHHPVRRHGGHAAVHRADRGVHPHAGQDREQGGGQGQALHPLPALALGGVGRHRGRVAGRHPGQPGPVGRRRRAALQHRDDAAGLPGGQRHAQGGAVGAAPRGHDRARGQRGRGAARQAHGHLVRGRAEGLLLQEHGRHGRGRPADELPGRGHHLHGLPHLPAARYHAPPRARDPGRHLPVLRLLLLLHRVRGGGAGPAVGPGARAHPALRHRGAGAAHLGAVRRARRHHRRRGAAAGYAGRQLRPQPHDRCRHQGHHCAWPGCGGHSRRPGHSLPHLQGARGAALLRAVLLHGGHPVHRAGHHPLCAQRAHRHRRVGRL
mmetsp:Transcript_34698/g.87801  ORF Transcript_34698/g.87801 Transcript_34698/m.87801 type:complete len:471 (+) Transcript_34698:235-1647(+)